MKRTFLVVLTLAACLAGPVAADMPQLLNYQGVLTDGSGVAVPDNTYSIVFAIYNVPSGGSELWSETKDVVVSKGTFSALLGTTTGLGGLAFNETYYIGMSIGGGPELPRQILTASPYSFTSKSVSGTNNVFPSSGFVGVGTTSPTHPMEVNGSTQTGIQYNGSDPSWASIYTNAVQANAIPMFGYLRQGTLRAYSLVNQADQWVLYTGGAPAITVFPSGDVGLGVAPFEKLDIDGGLRLGDSYGSLAGTIRWTGSDFEGSDGASWKSFTAGGGGGLPAGTLGQTLRHNGISWAATSNLFNDGSNIGIGTASPTCDLHVYRDADATVGITIENPNTGPNSTQRIDFADENGTVAGITIYDNNNAAYPSEMHLFNNRAGGALELSSGSGFVSIHNNGNVGINIADPTARMNVKGGNWDLNATEGDLKIGDGTYRLKFGVALDGAGAGNARIFATGGTNKLILGGGSNEVLALDATGAVDIGSSSANGELRLFRSGVANRVLRAYTDARGGNLDLYDESNNLTGFLEADGNGSGGYLAVYRAAGQAGFTVDGNAAGLNEPVVSITGTSQSVVFDMDQSGTNTVQLPISAIHSAEIADEPGAASYVEGGGLGIALTTGVYNTLATRAIVTPGAGYVLVIASCQGQEIHTNGTAGSANFGVSTASNSLPANQDVNWTVPSALPTSVSNLPITVHGLFSVASGGSHTYYFLGYPISGAFTCFDFQFTLIYIPTSYGTIDPTVAGASIGESETGGGRALSEAQVASARAESEAANAARIQRELDAMRAELDAVKTSLENK